MDWEYMIISLFIGILIGILVMYIKNNKLYKQKIPQHELENNKATLEEYNAKLLNYFNISFNLLDNIVRDYRQLYKHIVKNSNDVLPGKMTESNIFYNSLKENETDNDQISTQMPLDYLKDTTSFLQKNKKYDQ